jgi:hypothetical protein
MSFFSGNRTWFEPFDFDLPLNAMPVQLFVFVALLPKKTAGLP